MAKYNLNNLDTILDYDKLSQVTLSDANHDPMPERFGTRRIGMAIVGVGRMGAVHLSNVLKEPRAKLLYIVDSQLERLNFLCKKYYLAERGVKAVTLDKWDEILNDKEVEAIVISTSFETHEKFLHDGLTHNKNILCEKPFSNNPLSIKPFLAMAKERNLSLILATNRRYDPDFRLIKHQVERGDIGKPRFIRTCSKDSPPPHIEYIKTSGGIVFDSCIHDIDSILWIAKELPIYVHAQGVSHSQEYKDVGDFDMIVITMRFRSGLMSVTDLSRVSVTGYDQRLEVFGPLGTLKFDESPPVNVEKHCAIGCIRANNPYFFGSRYSAAYANEIIELFNHIEGLKVMEPRNDKYLPALNKVLEHLDKSSKIGNGLTIHWADEEQCF